MTPGAKTPGADNSMRRAIPPTMNSANATVGLASNPKHLLHDRAAKLVHRHSGGLHHHGTRRRLRGSPVELLEHRFHVGSNEVDDVEVERLLLRVGPRIRHGVLQGLGVATADVGNAADEGAGILVDLARERVRQVHAARPDHRGRADVGARRHDGEVGRDCQEGPRRSRPGARGRYVDRDGDGRFEELLNDLTSGVHESARRVQADHDQRGAVVARFVDASRNVVGGERLDGAVDVDDEHMRLVSQDGVRGLPGQQRNGGNQRHDGDETSHNRHSDTKTHADWDAS